MAEVKDKHGGAIRPGDHVYTKIRGGRHEGEVYHSTESHTTGVEEATTYTDFTFIG
jgi:hypothetical protein